MLKQLNTCLLLLIFLFYSCVSEKFNTGNTAFQNNKYDSEYPTTPISDELSFIASTVKKIDCLVFYMNYSFSPGNKLSRENINDSLMQSVVVSRDVSNESVTGTATVVYLDSKQAGLLTCAHVVDNPDSIFTYYDENVGGLKTLSVQIKNNIFISGFSQNKEAEIVVLNEKKDLALLKTNINSNADNLKVMSYPPGNTNDLEWGSLLYIVGYPLGNLMVTNAIVSNPDHAASGTFLSNALFNRGISGSPVFSIRDGLPNMEMVGIASSAAAQSSNYLKPEKDFQNYLNPDGSYSGKFIIEQKKEINYGVTFVIAIEEAMEMIRKNREHLFREGFIYENFFK